MSVIIILLGASLLVAIFFLAAFIWSVRNGQFEDNFSPAHRMLFETKPNESTCSTGNACTNSNCKSRICQHN
ncbi:cbb3-type cytochrome oxidase assembly protein CcoS [Chitinophaga agri]|uniref:Cbb3-type cytochrome oxidase assembly protein CcoS n=1 Tax=Chitinophaga agri TaxID=2703787 RepID=A0A6B9ZJ84_9BACT|nr:cbb3-type cytochrome oxidase assembly protein CcoS [Chitinophaga agri]QHS61611.1 cbb3-type cytochrome oxidase assembly protein CcoS [Chitinophaga agri]